MALSIEPHISSDGSVTLIHPHFNEAYHSLKDGAMTETMQKHVLPPIEYAQTLKREKVRILDICFGLGYNTFYTIYYYLKCGFKGEIEIYSPERDQEVFEILTQIHYPQEIAFLDGMSLKEVIQILKNKQIIQNYQWKIECYFGDAREYLKGFEENFFDVVYQDAFSPNKNPELWSQEYFSLLLPLIKEDGVLTTYSQKGTVKECLKRLGMHAYEIRHLNIRPSRIFSKQEIKSDFLIKK